MHDDTSLAIQGQTLPGEKVLWSGRLPSGVILHASDLLTSLSTILVAIFLLVVTTKTVGHQFLPFVTAWIVLITSYNLVGRFLVDAAWREHSYYAVTDQRILIVTRLFGVRVKSLDLHGLPKMSLKENPSGAGTITFGRRIFTLQWALRGGRTPPPQAPRFEGIENVREVLYLIQRTQAGVLTQSSPD